LGFGLSKDKDKDQEKENAEAPPIQPSIARNLSDKLYEKRKLGALEIEQLIKDLNNNKDEDKIKSVVQHLVTNYSDSLQGNSRKGGLIALAAAAIGLGSEAYKYVPQVAPPISNVSLTKIQEFDIMLVNLFIMLQK